MARQELQNAAQHEPLQEEPLYTDNTVLTNSRGSRWSRTKSQHARTMDELAAIRQKFQALNNKLEEKIAQLKTDGLERA